MMRSFSKRLFSERLFPKRLRASLTRNETTRMRRPHTMPPLTATLTLRQLARLWPTLSARCLTLRLA